MTFLTFILNYWFISARKNEILNNEEVICERYGSIFEELEITEFKTLLYYPLFFLRRAFYSVVLYNFSFSPMLQVTLNSAHTLVAIVFIVYVKPFESKVMNYLNLIHEICVFFTFMLTGTYLLDLSSTLEKIIMYIIMGFVGLSLFLSYVYSTYQTIESLIKKCRRKERFSVTVAPSQDLNNDKTVIKESLSNQDKIKYLRVNGKKENIEIISSFSEEVCLSPIQLSDFKPSRKSSHADLFPINDIND